MKKIYYLLAFVAGITALSACNPLDQTYKQLGDLPAPTAPATSVTITLATADYGLLPTTDYAKTALGYKSKADAAASIPKILTSKYGNYGDKSTALVTYGLNPITIALPDSLNANVSYTLQTTPTNDYIFPGNTFSNLSASAVLNWLAYKYPSAVANELHVLTYLYFESGKTAGSGTLTTDAFMFIDGAWQKIYRVSNAQYASVGNGLNNWFVAADAPNLAAYFNAFLKADPTVMLTAKAGDVKYVNFRYLTTFQRVMPLRFDGTNWTATQTLIFAKTNGTWIADNTVTYVLNPTDHVYLSGLTFGSAAARANLASFKSVDLRSTSATKWLPSEIADAVRAFAKYKYPTAEQNQIFILSYYGYTGTYAYVPLTFKYVGTDFVLQP